MRIIFTLNNRVMKKEELNKHYKSLTGIDLSESQLATIRILENSATAFRRKINNDLPVDYLENALIWHDIFVIAMSYGYTVNSGYRCPELNKLVGGVPTSLHQKALAVDFNISNGSDTLIRHRFLNDLLRFLESIHMTVKHTYVRNNMAHIELKYK